MSSEAQDILERLLHSYDEHTFVVGIVATIDESNASDDGIPIEVRVGGFAPAALATTLPDGMFSHLWDDNREHTSVLNGLVLGLLKSHNAMWVVDQMEPEFALTNDIPLEVDDAFFVGAITNAVSALPDGDVECRMNVHGTTPKNKLHFAISHLLLAWFEVCMEDSALKLFGVAQKVLSDEYGEPTCH